MKIVNRIALALAALALGAVPALGQGMNPHPAPTPAPIPHEAAQTEAERAVAHAEQAAATEKAKQAASAQSAQGAEKSQHAKAAQHAEQARLQAEKAREEFARVAKELARVRLQHTDEASKLAAQELEQKLKEMQLKVQEALTKTERERERALYERGTTALDQARYEKALQAFAEAAAIKGVRADGALYWKAFAEFKQAATKAALESLKEFQEQFPASRWAEQVRALEFEVRHATGEPPSPAATPDEELKLLALNSLLRTDAEQALPMLEKMINGPASPRLKKRALFVVSQSASPKAKEILLSAAKSPADPDLQVDAIQYLQALGGAGDKALLSGIYAASADRDVKLRLIDALHAQGDAKGLVELARKETDAAMKKRIVERLSTMRSKDATDYMMEIIGK